MILFVRRLAFFIFVLCSFCESLSAQVPVADFSISANPICRNQSVIITDLSTNTPTSWSYTMTSGTPSTSTVQSPTVTYNTAGTFTIRLVACNGNGCSTVTTKTILVNPLPAVNINPIFSTVCLSDSIILTAGGAATYTWVTGANTSTISVKPTVTVNTTYSVVGTSTAGCIASKTGTVAVKTMTLSAYGNPVSICSGTSSTLTAIGSTSYSWMPGGLISNSIVVSPTVTTIYTVTGTNGVCTSSIPIVILNNTPILTTTVSSLKLCSGESSTLNASGGNTYTWSTGSHSTGVVVSPSVTTNYTVTATGNGGCTKSVVRTITVNPLPVVNLTVNKDTACDYDQPLTLTGTPSGGNYSGINVSGNVFTPIPAGTYKVYYDYTDVNNCSNSDSAEIVVNLCVGIKETAQKNVKFAIYPNPNQGMFNIDLAESASVFIYDYLGNLVFDQLITAGKQQINLENYPKGIYFIKINSSELSSGAEKIIIR